MNEILKQLIEKKKADIIQQKEKVSRDEIERKACEIESFSRFTPAILNPSGKKNVSVIGEIKLASPNTGKLGEKTDIIKRAKMYEKAGFDAISFITEPHYFHGSTDFIPKIKKTVNLPVLQKDFVIDEYQIFEAKLLGSDALLLIARILDGKTLTEFVEICQDLEIEPVVEINSEEEITKAAAAMPSVIAVNARDLDTFSVDIDRACEVLRKVPEKFIRLGFSGIQSSLDTQKYVEAGAEGILVGTSLMKAGNADDFLKGLVDR